MLGVINDFDKCTYKSTKWSKSELWIKLWELSSSGENPDPF